MAYMSICVSQWDTMWHMFYTGTLQSVSLDSRSTGLTRSSDIEDRVWDPSNWCTLVAVREEVKNDKNPDMSGESLYSSHFLTKSSLITECECRDKTH